MRSYKALPVLLALLLPVSCGSPERRPPNTPDGAARMEFTDAIGRKIVLQSPAARVVSLAPNVTEILFAIGAGAQVVGRTKYCDFPAEALSVPVMGDMLTIDYERIVRQRPDAVLMTIAGNTQSGYDKLLGLGLQPVAVDASTVAGAINSVDTVGMITGHADKAARLSASLRATVDSVRGLSGQREPVKVFLVIGNSPLITVSRGFLAEQIRIAGGSNIAADMAEAYPKFSREELLRRDPDVIIIPAASPDAVGELLRLYPEWRTVSAVRNNRVRIVDPNIVMRPGPRIGQSVRLLYQALHD